MIGAHDSLVLLFMETRQARPPVYLPDEWQSWLTAMAQVITAFPTPERRWAAIVLIADDLARALPGTPLDLAFVVVQRAVNKATTKERV